MRGPIDYIIVGFEGNKFTGEILNELAKATEQGTIAVLALALVARDADGTVTAIQMDQDDIEFVQITGSMDLHNELITEDDVQETGDMIDDGTAAGLLVIEHLWAKGLKQAIINAGGTLIADGRIHPEAIEELALEEV